MDNLDPKTSDDLSNNLADAFWSAYPKMARNEGQHAFPEVKFVIDPSSTEVFTSSGNKVYFNPDYLKEDQERVNAIVRKALDRMLVVKISKDSV
jgi:hypothetical protein